MICCKCGKDINAETARHCLGCGKDYCEDCASSMCDCTDELGFYS